MSKTRRWVAFGAAALVAVTIAVGVYLRPRVRRISTITGAVITQHQNPQLERPVANASVTVSGGTSAGKAVSESSGLFRVRLDAPVYAGEVIEFRVNHEDFKPFAMTTIAGEQIRVIRLTRSQTEAHPGSDERRTPISNIRVRYATRSTSTNTVGTAVRTFEVANAGNVPCQNQPPCSPDGKWKASVGTLTLDAGEQKQFRNVRASCIAGPCPFTSIESDRFTRGGRVITVSVRNWSDRVTYLVEAEVAQTMDSDLIRYTYPVTFGASMNFTLPPQASGPSIEADIDGMQIVFPLGPHLRLSWATCRFENGPEGTKQYRCELKPEYRFD